MGYNLASCTSPELKCDAPLTPMGEKLIAKVIPVLEKHQIYYEQDDSGEICVSTAKYETLKIAMNKFFDTNIPNDRSISASSELMRRYKSRFLEDQIPFEEYELQEAKFYVWQKNDSKAAQKIITEEEDKYFSELELELRK